MEILNNVLPIVIDILLVVLLTVGIILIIKCIYLIDKAKSLVLNVEEKVNSLNSLFSLVSIVSDKVSMAGERIVSKIESLILRWFTKKTNDEVDEEDELRSILDEERDD